MTDLSYELYYWPSIQGRGEFVRLALEAASAPYLDIARDSGGVALLEMLLRGTGPGVLPFAPPFLVTGELVIAQTANILQYLAPRHDLVPDDEASRIGANQLMLSIADLVNEVHDTHHPVAMGLHYEDQKPEAARRAHGFITARLPGHVPPEPARVHGRVTTPHAWDSPARAQVHARAPRHGGFEPGHWPPRRRMDALRPSPSPGRPRRVVNSSGSALQS